MIKSPMNYKKLANFMLFLAGWWTALLYGNALALIALFVVLMLHFILWRDVRDIFIILVFIFCGFGIEWAFMASGVQDYRSNLPPAWVICIWAMLATIMRYSLSWLVNKPLWAALVGLLIAPVFYYNSVQFGPAGWSRPMWQCLLVISLVWGGLAAFISGVLVPIIEQMETVESSDPKNTVER
ncbi:DUF2878 domain-containing protein [Microbulbifer bruguierae]|uniref:DUF2878 domain-containing protein n=1 Tax=Microbulbifer bruguierae TaxID=3029061 RepID=A0ABY8NHZ9_9GAMM|nr:DUF2878 domain-containing protein [Microbulbifer bruguierae]WGL18080.1 DUF2878 domain-containing protein [Microbulbifer bruguierae]